METHAPTGRIGLIADRRADATALDAVLVELRKAGVGRIVAFGDLAGEHGRGPGVLTAPAAEYRPVPSVLCVEADRGRPARRLEEFRDFVREAVRLRARHPAVVVCCFGHTHRPRAIAVRDAGGVVELFDTDVALPDHSLTFINPGTAEHRGDGEPAAAFAILDLDARRVSFRQLRYEPTTNVARAHHVHHAASTPVTPRAAGGRP